MTSAPATRDARRRSGAPRSIRRWLLAGAGSALALALANVACRLPPEAASGTTSNVAVAGEFAYATLAERGLGVYRVQGGELVAELPPPHGAESVDDVAIADGLLFALDAKTPGHLAVYSLARPAAPELVAPAREVPVGPFSGVAAARGRVLVSGGTSELTVAHYDAGGRLAAASEALDLGRGQPDVAIAADGEHAYVSTHFSLLADTFGLTTLAVAGPSGTSRALATLELAGAGFTPGGRRPANFPLEMAVRGTQLLVAYGRGLAVVDVANPAAPELAAVLPLDLAAVSVDVRGSRAVLVGSEPEPALVVVELSGAAGPWIVERIALARGSEPTGVALGDGVAVVAAQGAGVQVVPLR